MLLDALIFFVFHVVGSGVVEAGAVEDAKCQTTILRTSGYYQFSCMSLTSLQMHMEKGPQNTTKISVVNSKISTIPRYSFVKFGATLDALELRNCGIEAIEADAFGSLARLQKLILAENRLKEINGDIFKDTPYLQELDVSFNKIKSIRSDVYQRVPYLTLFYFDYNELETIDYSMFSVLPNLKRVKLGHNPWNWAYRALLTWQLDDQKVNYQDDWEEWGWMSSAIRECKESGNVNELTVAILDCVVGKLLRMDVGSGQTISAPEIQSIGFDGRCINEAMTLVQCTPEKSVRRTMEDLVSTLKDMGPPGAKFNSNF